MRRIFIVLILLLTASTAWATERHVNNAITCSDSNSGTSPASPKCTIQSAIGAMVAGDTTTVHAGTYSDTGLNLNGRIINIAVRNKAGGSASVRYTIHTANDGPVILSGVANSQHAALYLENSPGVTFDGFTITGFNPSGIPDARPAVVYCTGSNNEKITNLTISGSTQLGGEFTEITVIRSYDGEVSHNTITTVNKIGISYEGPTSISTGNVAINRIDTGSVFDNHITQTRDVFTSVTGIFVMRVNSTLIYQNSFINTDPNKNTNAQSRGMYLRDTQGIIIRENVFSNYLWGIDIHDASDSDNGCGGGACQPARLDPNGVPTWNENETATLNNNVFNGLDPNNTKFSSGVGVRVADALQSCDGCIFKNLIIKGYAKAFDLRSGNPSLYPSTSIVDRNLFFQNNIGNTITDATITNSTTGDPAFVGSGATPSPFFNLTVASPARNIGDNAYCPWSPGDGQCDAGAYEFAATVTRPGSIIISSFDMLPRSTIGVLSFDTGNLLPGHAALYRLTAHDIENFSTPIGW